MAKVVKQNEKFPTFAKQSLYLCCLLLRAFLFFAEDNLIFLDIYNHNIPFHEFPFQHLQRERIENQPLDRALETFGGPHSAISSPPLGKAEQTGDSRILCQVKIF